MELPVYITIVEYQESDAPPDEVEVSLGYSFTRAGMLNKTLSALNTIRWSGGKLTEDSLDFSEPVNDAVGDTASTAKLFTPDNKFCALVTMYEIPVLVEEIAHPDLGLYPVTSCAYRRDREFGTRIVSLRALCTDWDEAKSRAYSVRDHYQAHDQLGGEWEDEELTLQGLVIRCTTRIDPLSTHSPTRLLFDVAVDDLSVDEKPGALEILALVPDTE